MKYHAIIAAAGSGVRFGGSTKKPFLMLRGRTLLEHTVNIFVSSKLFSSIVVVLAEEDIPERDALNSFSQVTFVAGGASRSESVYKGFCALKAELNDGVLIHDVVRPLVTLELIQGIARLIAEKKAVIPVVPVKDTIKVIRGNRVEQTLPRGRLVSVQTPQGFSCALLQEVYKNPHFLSEEFTDEAMMVEGKGFEVHTIPGEPNNIKITTPLDLKLAECLIPRLL